MLRCVFVLGLVWLLAACQPASSSGTSIGGGGGTGGCGNGGTVLMPNLGSGNVADIVVDSGPASLNTCNASGITNVAYVTIKICAPGTASCVLVDHVLVDTGSVGLRIVAGALNASFVAALPDQTDVHNNTILECTQFVDGYVWGPVKTADFTVAGESVAAMPLQLIGAAGYPTAPGGCTAGGGKSENTVSTFAANGILGIGPFTVDCGSHCALPGSSQAVSGASYWICPSANCSLSEEDESGSAPNLQIPNPVSRFATDNNGSIINLQSVQADGQATATGSLIFGIGTQSNNSLGSATIYTISNGSSSFPGSFTTLFNGQSWTQSYIDSGTSILVFEDPAIPVCDAASGAKGFYCPVSTLVLDATNTGLNNASGVVYFNVANAGLMNFNFSVLPELAIPPSGATDSFAWGLPFFYGRSVYTAIDGALTHGGKGPYFAY